MIGLDTNVLVRYIAQDDARQSARAARLIESFSPEAPGFVSVVALIELVWVLASCYELDRAELASVLESLLRSRELRIDRAEAAWAALRLFRAGKADFADCLIERLGHEAGCEATVSFDQAAAKACGMRVLA